MFSTKKIQKISLVIFLIVIFAPFATEAAGMFDYKLMESIPFVGQSNTNVSLSTLISGSYKLLLWLVMIAALFMLSVGAFYYMTSAGNTSNASTAKKIITDSLLGIVVAMTSWALLYIINPDLVAGDKATNTTFFTVDIGPKNAAPTQPVAVPRNETWIGALDTSNSFTTTPINLEAELAAQAELDCSDPAQNIAGEDTCPESSVPVLEPGPGSTEQAVMTPCSGCSQVTTVACTAPSCEMTESLATSVQIADASVKNEFTESRDTDGNPLTPPVDVITASLTITKAYTPVGATISGTRVIYSGPNDCYASGLCASVTINSLDPVVVVTDPAVVKRAYDEIVASSPSMDVTYHASDCESYIAVGVSCVADGGNYSKIATK